MEAVVNSTPPTFPAQPGMGVSVVPLSMTTAGGARVQPMDGNGHDVSPTYPLPVTGQVFAPPAVNSTIGVTATSQSIAFQNAGTVVLIQNVGMAEAFFALGGSAVTATAGGSATNATDGSTSIPPGAIATYAIGTNTYIAAICAGSATTTLRISVGSGQ